MKSYCCLPCFLLVITFSVFAVVTAGDFNYAVEFDVNQNYKSLKDEMKTLGANTIFFNLTSKNFDEMLSYIFTSLKAGYGGELYYSPDNTLNGYRDFMNLYTTFNDIIQSDRYWLSTLHFSPNETEDNVNFITEFKAAALSKNVKIGILTDPETWNKITPDDDKEFAKNMPLWYVGNQDKNFDDFKPFGGWSFSSAFVKRFDKKNSFNVDIWSNTRP